MERNDCCTGTKQTQYYGKHKLEIYDAIKFIETAFTKPIHPDK